MQFRRHRRHAVEIGNLEEGIDECVGRRSETGSFHSQQLRWRDASASYPVRVHTRLLPSSSHNTSRLNSSSSKGPRVPQATPAAWRSLPAGIWALGFVSLFMDMSSELIHALLPVFMVTDLGASMLTVDIIEVMAEATDAIMKCLSGSLCDYLGRRN